MEKCSSSNAIQWPKGPPACGAICLFKYGMSTPIMKIGAAVKNLRTLLFTSMLLTIKTCASDLSNLPSIRRMNMARR